MFGSSSTSAATHVISVLFSEPKIPQSIPGVRGGYVVSRFSALQRAENSSISHQRDDPTLIWSFSALQRAENSSMGDDLDYRSAFIARFSALQRAENSSIDPAPRPVGALRRVSVLFSEPKIPQWYSSAFGSRTPKAFQCSSASRKFLNRLCRRSRPSCVVVSVLFSEPKIPQCHANRQCEHPNKRFSALQRAENSSISKTSSSLRKRTSFQCSSASRKFLNRNLLPKSPRGCAVSVLFSEPKIPQSNRSPADTGGVLGFQCSSASRKFLNCSNRDRSASVGRCFSALQRAENSSITTRLRLRLARHSFSALQRAENSSIQQSAHPSDANLVRFSALQRAENSSIRKDIRL